MEQTTLDFSKPEQLKAIAMEQVEENANEEFKRVAFKSIQTFALNKETITANDVWASLDLLGITTHDNRALGPIFKKAAKYGLIEKTNTTTKSNRCSRHCGDVRVWRSLVF